MLDNAGNLGIGTSSPGAKLDVNGDLKVSPNTAGKNTFSLTTNASNDGSLFIKSDTTDKVNIQANGSSYFEGGTVRFISTISVGNSTPSTSGAGITFPASDSPSSDANTLDDYEEGTWTPAIAGDGTEFVGATYGGRGGKYVKVGDVVWVSFDIEVSATGTMLNSASVGGLPFAIPNAGNLSNGGGGLNYVNNLQTNYVYQSCYPQNNSSYLFIIGRTAASTSSITVASSSFFTNSIRLAGFAWYRTTV